MGVSAAQYYARRLGITSTLPPIPSLALGTAEVSLIDLTTAYGVFADNGALVSPHLISRVEDSAGDVIWQSSTTAVQILRPGTAFLMSSMLADVITRGTGSQARSQGFKLPAAGKTGTTNDSADAWFVGYTPNLVAGVWFGRDQPEPIIGRATAATIAVPAWARFMKQATASDRPDWYQMPSDFEKVAICQVSGMRATPACRLAAANRQGGVVDDYFPKGTAPKEPCSVHVDQLALPGEVAQPAGQPIATTGAVPGRAIAIAQKRRRREPLRIRVVREDKSRFLHAINQVVRNALSKRRAAPASAETPLRARNRFAHIRGTVDHDRAVHRAIVEAGIQPVEPKRVAVLADVRVFRGEKADARLVGLGVVGELGRHVVAAALPVRHELLKEQRMRAKVDDPQSLLG